MRNRLGFGSIVAGVIVGLLVLGGLGYAGYEGYEYFKSQIPASSSEDTSQTSEVEGTSLAAHFVGHTEFANNVQSVAVTFAVAPSNASDKYVIWSIDNPTGATWAVRGNGQTAGRVLGDGITTLTFSIGANDYWTTPINVSCYLEAATSVTTTITLNYTNSVGAIEFLGFQGLGPGAAETVNYWNPEPVGHAQTKKPYLPGQAAQYDAVNMGSWHYSFFDGTKAFGLFDGDLTAIFKVVGVDTSRVANFTPSIGTAFPNAENATFSIVTYLLTLSDYSAGKVTLSAGGVSADSTPCGLFVAPTGLTPSTGSVGLGS